MAKDVLSRWWARLALIVLVIATIVVTIEIFKSGYREGQEIRAKLRAEQAGADQHPEK